ncbi:Endosulfine-domain-containing protein [Cryphonectria parasitica EP155]|uniref:mRNA stability protein n=1 Tax=Cryphonectria parasitica (strain ATCC 38755 / EP155) TaxID=660469 RepID=A0A9P5CK58_CRYP1|nr:Endosulfine-domain-containing protein [Cryphonectria parasitica EP155]KAF3760832.1 Endosulfine-domain-containing protein [Cryphonectria parasitica EP155]
MNPHQKNKIDVSSLSPEEQRLFRLYGKLPSQKDRFMKNKLGERKYFDSGDYAMNKAGKGDGMETGHVGSEHPDPESIRHGSVVSPVTAGAGGASPVVPTLTKSGSVSGPSTAGFIPVGSPAKESGLQRETSVEDTEDAAGENKENNAAAGGDGAAQQGIPIRS